MKKQQNQDLFDLTTLPRSTKRLIMVLADLALIPLALWSAFVLRLGDPFTDLTRFWWLFVAAPAVSVPLLIRLGLYRAVMRFMGSQAAMAVIKGATLSALLLATLTLLSGVKGVPRSVFIIYWGAMVIYVGGSRFLVRSYLHSLVSTKSLEKEGVIIYGAGHTGIQLANILINGDQYTPLAFIDDSKEAHGSVINGIRVYPPKALPDLINRLEIRQLLLAIPSAGRSRRRAIVDSLESLPVHVRTIPGMADLVSGSARVDEIREIEIEDLLTRDTVAPDSKLLEACITNKSVLVTGAGGSIGSELCRQIIRLNPTRLILLEISEYSLYRLERELQLLIQKEKLQPEIQALLGTVQEQKTLESIMRTCEVDTVYHAAAYKHVPLVENNPVEAVRNNIFGTLAAAQAAAKAGVGHFVLISTDKAVRPTNIMGATKRMAEMLVQALSKEHKNTLFSIVRFGNVLGSSGSVVPLFREQIRNGGPVTVTHPDIIRYFMTIPEAAQLVIQASAMSGSGDVFVLDMGEPIKIADLARKMIHLSGFDVKDDNNPDGDIEITYTGLRPGEKLYEELLIGENPIGTHHPRILKAEEEILPWDKLAPQIELLHESCDGLNIDGVKDILIENVHGYSPRSEIETNLMGVIQSEDAQEIATPANQNRLLH